MPTILALAQGAEVLATDHYEVALDFTTYNARTNLDREPKVSVLDWREPDTGSIGTYDLIFAAMPEVQQESETPMRIPAPSPL